MNILVTSAGRRVKLVQYIKRTINKVGNVTAVDCDYNAPALHFGDNWEIIPRVDSKDYLSSIISVCKKHNIKGIISLIDPELEILAKHREKFNQLGVELVLSPLGMIEYSFDKQETYNYLSEIGVPTIPTYSILREVESMLKNNEITYPLIVKPGKGSASVGLEIVNNQAELKGSYLKADNLIIQPYYKDREYGIDVYIDMISGELIDLFIKEKLKMRSGETDKSVSIHNSYIEELVMEFVSKTNFSGPIDIDCFEHKGEYYISEINPRFGGGYPHAHELGCNFIQYLVRNLCGEINDNYNGYRYDNGYIMMKYDDIRIMDEHEG
ncbi:ATP-grasp domain-containing protein [Thalassobacillus sp. CUG 92003]|uniref:ATP-grasp domain-containing protein n=1 Tax=Thalassobacillus sp. CUG 92003 TaxID=2736641 RepID=UPI0015E6691B|nr:ATP-grasp domain-containing protein [Thalassobacillus sp. CUG 92003]